MEEIIAREAGLKPEDILGKDLFLFSLEMSLLMMKLRLQLYLEIKCFNTLLSS